MNYIQGTQKQLILLALTFTTATPSVEIESLKPEQTEPAATIETECVKFDPKEQTDFATKNITYNNKKEPKRIKLRYDVFPQKKYTIMVYIAADNDLHYFAWNNIKQLAKGANEHVHIVVQLNEPGANKKTQRYLIEKNKAILLNKEDKTKLNSGDPKTLLDFCCDTIEMFPAEKYILDLSNHGSGSIDRKAARLANTTDLFYLNPTNMMLELDRKIEYLDYMQQNEIKSIHKGICFDETFRSYLTNKQLQQVLEEVSKKTLGGDKISMVWMDACLMAGLEVAALLKSCCKYLIASQEVELGPGWRYDKVLKPFCHGHVMKEEEFASHIVKAYEETYANITNEYTLSALRLNKIEEIEKNVDLVGSLLEICLEHQESNYTKKTIKKCKNKITFEEPSYMDLATFYTRLISSMADIKINPLYNSTKESLLVELDRGLRLIQQSVVENVAGNNVLYAQGVSIYLPERGVHHSYLHSDFAKTNRWANFINAYLTS
jgi:hypothetical protein